jgi:hypothetical protein
LADAEAIGAEPTTTLVVATEIQPDALVTVTVYMPPAALVTFDRVGFCCKELNPFGPLQE